MATIRSAVLSNALDGTKGSAAGAKASCAAVFALGAGLVFLVGFVQSSALHDAAHDTRHGLAFPCH